ncbi:MAG: MarR family winged helix-turn-helix transcriptional regulator [Pseudomonadota bacterium]
MDSECHCTQLRAAARRVASAYDQALEPAGLNVAQFALLRRISRRDSISLTQLGELAELDRSTVGRNVRVLAREGLVELGSGTDQREAVVALTRRGRNKLEQAAPLWKACQQGIETRVGRERLRALHEALERI